MTGMVLISKAGGCGGGGGKESRRRAAAAEEEENQLSLVTLLLAALRKSMLSSCKLDEREAEFSSSVALQKMEIGWPTNVQHLTHVTFDRFHGFLGLPVEFEVEIPCRVPSARSLPSTFSIFFGGLKLNFIFFFLSCCVFLNFKFLFWVLLIIVQNTDF